MILFISIFFIGCSNISSKVNDNILTKDTILQSKEIITYKKFEYPIDNERASEFPYAKGDLFDGGIKSMIIYGDYCLFVDEVHRNIKKINLKDGTKKVSEGLTNTPGRSLVDIAIHNNLIYVSSRQKEIFVLDQDLKMVRTIEIGTQGGNDMFFTGKSGSNLLILIGVNDTLVEMDISGKEISRKKVSPYNKEGVRLISTGVRFGKMVTDTIITNALDKELYYYTYFQENEDSYIRGKKYKIIKKENSNIFINDRHEIKLMSLYTHLENTDIDFVNDLDFDDKYLVIFEVKSPSIIIHVYTTSQ